MEKISFVELARKVLEEEKKPLTTFLGESFFQAVSNSSRVNEGYLAASEIAKEENFLKENLDWETINKIVQLNPDFKNFITRITNDIQVKEIREEEFDRILDIK